MMTIQSSTVSHLEKYLIALRDKEKQLQAEEDRIAKELRETAEMIAAVNLFLRTYPEWEASNFASEAGADILPQDIAHCRTQKEALAEIAKLNGGIVRAKIAAKLIRAAGLSKGQANSAIASVHRTMTNSPDWEWVSPGSFRHKDFTPSGKDESDESPEESLLDAECPTAANETPLGRVAANNSDFPGFLLNGAVITEEEHSLT